MPRHQLIRLIEFHSQQLANELLTRIRNSNYLPSYSRVPENELKQRVYEIYSHFGQWLITSPEADIRLGALSR